MIVIDILACSAPIRAPPMRRSQTSSQRSLDLPVERQLCGNAAHERTFAPVASGGASHVRFPTTITPLRLFITASVRIQHPSWPPTHQHHWAS